MAEIELKGRKAAPRVDLTPMVDLGFLLISFFMFTTTLSKPKAMQIQMPYPRDDINVKPPQVKNNVAMTILLGESHKVYYYFGDGNNPLDPPELKLTGFRQQNGIRDAINSKKMLVQSLISEGVLDPDDKLTILIKPGENAKTVDLIEVLDEMTINSVPIYALTDITPLDLDLIAAVEKATGK